MLWMLGIYVVCNVGLAHFTQFYHIGLKEPGQQTVLSLAGRAIFGVGVMYYMLQASTAMILTLGANTSFADFPRLSSILARDGFAPRQLANLGDRLVFSNGILVLGVLSAVLVVIFKGTTHYLIPLYAVGVFVSFTLSQAGMIVHWRRLSTPGWKSRAAVNALGAALTGIVLIVVASVKFTRGAWIVILVIPIPIAIFLKIHRHYRTLAAALTLQNHAIPNVVRHEVVVLVPDLHRGIAEALLYAGLLSPHCHAVHVEVSPAQTARLQEKWSRLHLDIPLTVLKASQGPLVELIRDHVRAIRGAGDVDLVTVVLPEFATTKWWHPLLHSQSGLRFKIALMNEPGVVLTNVRFRAGA